jgi:hypothetical protein
MKLFLAALLLCLSQTPAQASVWISQTELMQLPVAGQAWTSVIDAANASLGTPDAGAQGSDHDVKTLACALAAVRLNDSSLRAKATAAIVAVIGTETSQSTDQWLAFGRNVGAYAIAADLLDLRADGPPSSAGDSIQAWLTQFLTRTMIQQASQGQVPITSFRSGSNADTQAGFAHAAILAYLGDSAGLANLWNGYKRYCGDRTSPWTMTSNDTSWQYVPSDPVGINDPFAMKLGCMMDGSIGNDMARWSGGAYSCSPTFTQYPWVGLEGAFPAAVVFSRAGYPAFSIVDSALQRALAYLWQLKQSTGDNQWFDGVRANEIVWLGNWVYGANNATGVLYPIVGLPIGPGRTVGWTDWTHPLKNPPSRPTPVTDISVLE